MSNLKDEIDSESADYDVYYRKEKMMEKNRINILENQYKKSDKSPHYVGFATVNGTDYKVALWPAKNGNGYSGEISRKEDSPAAQPPPKEEPPAPSESSYGAADDTEVPF